MTTRTHPLVTAWLDRLEQLSRDLPQPQREELRSDLREHLGRALADDASDEHVRRTLARMGDPVDIVAAAMEDQPPAASDTPGAAAGTPPPPPAQAPADPDQPGLSAAEVVTLVALVLAGVLLPAWPLAVASWLLAVTLLVTRDRWRGVEVAVALWVPIGFSLVWVGGLATFSVSESCHATGGTGGAGQVETVVECGAGGATPAGIAVTVLLVVGVLSAGWAIIWLGRRLRARHPGT